jgi:hypothetical protein
MWTGYALICSAHRQQILLNMLLFQAFARYSFTCTSIHIYIYIYRYTYIHIYIYIPVWFQVLVCICTLRVSSRLYMHDDKYSIPVCLSLTYEAKELHGQMPMFVGSKNRTINCIAYPTSERLLATLLSVNLYIYIYIRMYVCLQL